MLLDCGYLVLSVLWIRDSRYTNHLLLHYKVAEWGGGCSRGILEFIQVNQQYYRELTY